MHRYNTTFEATSRDVVKWKAKEFVRDLFQTLGNAPHTTKQKLVLWVERNGGRVTYTAGAHVEETLRIYSDGTFEIFLPISSSEVRDNFTIAHELGHLMLHSGWPNQTAACFGRSGSNRMEWEANWFAAEVLMPEDLVREFVQRNGRSPDLMAYRFGVSVAAASVRLESMGL